MTTGPLRDHVGGHGQPRMMCRTRVGFNAKSKPQNALPGLDGRRATYSQATEMDVG